MTPTTIERGLKYIATARADWLITSRGIYEHSNQRTARMLIIQKELRRDTLAVEFVEHYFAGDGRVVTVNYGDAIVKKHDYVRTQLYLSDGRRVRVDHVSGRSRGESASLFVTIENVVEATNTVGTN